MSTVSYFHMGFKKKKPTGGNCPFDILIHEFFEISAPGFRTYFWIDDAPLQERINFFKCMWHLKNLLENIVFIHFVFFSAFPLCFSISMLFKREYEIHSTSESVITSQISLLSAWPCRLLWQVYYLESCMSQRNPCCFFILLPTAFFSLLSWGRKRKLRLCWFFL